MRRIKAYAKSLGRGGGRLPALLLLLGVVAVLALAGYGDSADRLFGGGSDESAESREIKEGDANSSPSGKTPAVGAFEDGRTFGGAEGEAAEANLATASPAAGSAADQAAATAAAGATGVEPLPATLEQSFLGRKVISNAEMQVEVAEGEFAAVFARLAELPLRFGGYLVSSETSASEEQDAPRSGSVSLRVPAERLPEVLEAAGGLGEVKARSVSSQDVTEEFVDLEARLKNARAQEQSLRELLARATKVEEILQVRNVLSSIQMEIEQLEGRLRYLEEHSDFATLTVYAFEPGVQVALTRDWGFLRALEEAGLAFVDTINGIIVFAGGFLPIAILALAAFWAVGRVWSRHSAESRKDG